MTGRPTKVRAAGAAAVTRLWTGLLFGMLLGLFTSGYSFFAAAMTSAAFGVLGGTVFGFAAHAATRGRRGFSSGLIARDSTVERARFTLSAAGLLPQAPLAG